MHSDKVSCISIGVVNGTLRNVALRKFRPDLSEVFWGGSRLKVSFSMFFPVPTEFSVFCGKDLRVLAFKSRLSEFIKDIKLHISNSARKI